MKTRPQRAVSHRRHGDDTDRGQIADDEGSGDGLNRDKRDVELIQTLKRMRQLLAQVRNKHGHARAATN